MKYVGSRRAPTAAELPKRRCACVQDYRRGEPAPQPHPAGKTLESLKDGRYETGATMKPMRLVTPLIALAVAIGVVVLPAIAVPIDPALARSGSAVSVQFAPANTGVLAPGEPLVLNGTIANPTGTAVPAGTAFVYLNRTPVGTRTELSSWLNPSSTEASDRRGTQVLESATPPVAPGDAVTLQLIVPATSIAFGPFASIWGARTLLVRVSANGIDVGQSRGSIVWNTGQDIQRTSLALAAPLIVPGSTEGLISAEALAADTAPGGVLSRQLSDVIDQNIAIGIDPRILASIRILGTATPPSALAWFERLRTATNVTFPLGYADYDLAAASQAHVSGVLAPVSFPVDANHFPGAQSPSPSPSSVSTAPPTPTHSPATGSAVSSTTSSTGTGTPTPTPSTGTTVPLLPDATSLLAWNYTIASIAWPADDTVVGSDLDAFAAGGLSTTILSSGNVDLNRLSYTPSGSAVIGSHRAVISDAGISTLFRAAATALSQSDWDSAMARLSSTLAVVSRERPADSRTLLATLGRSVPNSGDRLAQTLAALSALPWVASAPLTALTGATTTPIATSIVPKAEAQSRLQLVTSMLAAEASARSFSSVLDTPSQITGERRLTLLATLSNSWSADPTWPAGARKYVARSKAIVSSVSIAKSSSVHILATSSLLPVTVTNKLPWPVTVFVFVRSPNSLLSITTDRVSLTIQAESQAKVSVPVRANANGESQIGIRLRSGTDVAIAGPEFVDVDVQAGWETVFTAVAGALLLAIFAFGIYRNIAKRRREKASPARDDSLAGPESSE